ncbi:hypothetical protein G6F57_017517 [Rhizopus arrhizus]|nr:hypothetical protein G6F57_017517 [Rhizopus arrhizus]
MLAGSPWVTRSNVDTTFRRFTAATPLVKARSASISENSVCLLVSAGTVSSCDSGLNAAFSSRSVCGTAQAALHGVDIGARSLQVQRQAARAAQHVLLCQVHQQRFDRNAGQRHLGGQLVALRGVNRQRARQLAAVQAGRQAGDLELALVQLDGGGHVIGLQAAHDQLADLQGAIDAGADQRGQVDRVIRRRGGRCRFGLVFLALGGRLGRRCRNRRHQLVQIQRVHGQRKIHQRRIGQFGDVGAEVELAAFQHGVDLADCPWAGLDP